MVKGEGGEGISKLIFDGENFILFLKKYYFYLSSHISLLDIETLICPPSPHAPIPRRF